MICAIPPQMGRHFLHGDVMPRLDLPEIGDLVGHLNEQIDIH
jgi:hypothetical protein